MNTRSVLEMERIFHPESVSIIGASNREGSFGQLFLNGFVRMGFKNIYPVHPREKELSGLKAYPSIKDVPCEIDMAILIIPQGESVRVVRECAEKGVRCIVLFAAGFREKGEEGKKIEQEMAQIVHQHGIRMIGPNTNGLYSPSAKLLALPGSLVAGGLTAESGPLSVFSQSGSFNDYLCQVMTGKNIRFNKVVSCGNEADLKSEDFLEYFGEDKETRIIAGYLEGIKDGRKLFELAKNISKEKPIIIWKGGQTDIGAKAALAHTGSLAGSKQVWEAMFKQTGIVNVGSFEEMVDCLLAFSWLPLPEGKRIALLSGMGGTGVGTSDNCIMTGLKMATFTESTKQKLRQILPDVGTSISNPLDVGVGSLMAPEIFGKAAVLLAEDENVDMVMAISAPDNPRSIASLVDAHKVIKKPLVIALFDIPGLVEPHFKALLSQHIPTYYEPKRAAYALAKLAEYSEFKFGKKSGLF
jgi:acetate---CoA ligase (ADP-forming) subunit alpha